MTYQWLSSGAFAPCVVPPCAGLKRSYPVWLTALAVGAGCLLHAQAHAQILNPLSDTTNLLMQDHLKRMEEAASAKKPPPTAPLAAPRPSAPASDVVVLINEIQFSKTQLLTPEELKELGERYVGRRLGAGQIQALLDDVSQLYQNKGILTGVPVLPKQDLQTGVLRILLVEGRLGEVKVAEPGMAQADWVKRWFDLERNAVLTQEALRERLVLFNTASDFSATADMVAGAAFGQTDLSVAVNEGKRVQTWAFVERSTASTSPVQLAAGLRVVPFTIYGGRQDLSILATSAGKTGTGSMSFPLGTGGWRTTLSGSLARSESVVKGKDSSDLAIRGESAALTWDVSRAWVLAAPWLAGTTLGVSKHRSQTFLDTSDVPLLDRQSRKLSWLGTVEYDTPRQKGGLRGTFHVASETQNYRYAEFTGQWRHALDEAGLWSVKAAGLLRLKPSGELSSMDRFYLGGQDSVRGFSLGAGSGDRGAATQLEMRRSLRDWGGESGEAYVFWDAGLAQDPTRVADDRLRSAGMGVQVKINDSLGLDALASRQLSTPQASPSRLLLRLVYSH